MVLRTLTELVRNPRVLCGSLAGGGGGGGGEGGGAVVGEEMGGCAC